ncbi:MAG: 4-(cytidine 5'-diphospho)-2-C-methyl-D-erythritol kinase [Gemmatimonadota bacterium]|nr:4-(cytidine 5'-diphospho)-2-C-methyl-D-erythritol kinase [Gemmatimonadota bacterium]
MTTCVAIRAQAKLNLWLHVLAREESGYHSIETLFHRIDLADDVTVRLTPDGARTIECSEDVGPLHDNLAYRAAVLFCERTDWQAGFHIAITKRIPARGGLGGGSADAAAVLLAMNSLSPRAHSEASLAALGARLGADVPFLLSDAPCALAWAHGDRMLALPALPQRHVALVIPDSGISTAEAYASLTPGTHVPARITIDDLGSWQTIASLSHNDLSLSRAAISNSTVSESVAALRRGGAFLAGMSGSGSVLFGIFDSAPVASELELATGCRVLLTKTATSVARAIGRG